MTGRKDWLVDLDESVKKNVRFADNSTGKAEGLGRVPSLLKVYRVYTKSIKNRVYTRVNS